MTRSVFYRDGARRAARRTGSHRVDDLRAVLAPQLAADKGWSEDPMIVLRALATEARDMIEFHKGMGLHSVAYWEFVATECDGLADRIHEKWSSE